MPGPIRDCGFWLANVLDQRIYGCFFDIGTRPRTLNHSYERIEARTGWNAGLTPTMTPSKG